MTATRVLFVKLSSLGDVVHHLPAVTDLCARRPEARIHWAVEEAYAELVGLHPAVEHAIPIPLRRLRRRWGSRDSWAAMAVARRALRRHPYDYVIDTQGLLKSAAVARTAHGATFGFDHATVRERLAARFYDQGIRVGRAQHAVERNRQLVADVFGYEVDTLPNYGIAAPPSPPSWAPPRYYVALHATSRADKRWPEERWIELARRLGPQELVAVYPGGTAEERNAAARLAKHSPQAVLAPPMSLVQCAALLAAARGVVGVDTGLTHLAVALDVPTLGLYCATDPALTGLHGAGRVVNLGGVGSVPSVDQVLDALGFREPAAA